MPTNENPALAGGVSEDGHAATLIVSEDTPTTAHAAYAFHPLADIFPLMEGDEFEQLVADIKAHGQHARIVLKDGMILDGRNRYLACLAAGIEPMFACKAYSDQITDPAIYVVSANIRRRHLNREQRGELIIKIIASAPEKSDRLIAKSIGVTDKTVGAARAKGEQLRRIPQLNKTIGADGKARKRPQSRTERRRARLHSRLRSDAVAAAAPDPNPLITAWDNATRAQRHEFIMARKLEIMRAQQRIGRSAHEPTEVEPVVTARGPRAAVIDDIGDQTGAPDDPYHIPAALERTRGAA
jgi:ParB-like chromosome segregation protein Spo0J